MRFQTRTRSFLSSLFSLLLLLSICVASTRVGYGQYVPPPSSLTSHTVSAVSSCIAASASGTAYTCTTVPTFTPAAGDKLSFKSDVSNTGAATLNVNATSAAPVKKQGGVNALAATDFLAGQWTMLLFDGTNWQLQGPVGSIGPCSGVDMSCIDDQGDFSKLLPSYGSGFGWRFASICTGNPPVTSTNPGEDNYAQFQVANCYAYRGTDNGGALFSDFISGSTPRGWTLTARVGRASGTGTMYVGWCGTYNDCSIYFVGARYNSATSHWEVVAINNSVDIFATNIGVTPDFLMHTITCTNLTSGVPVANSVTCAVGGTAVTQTGTLVTHAWIPSIGSNLAAASIVWNLGRFGIHISGIAF